jgi:hypothetical protein
VTYLIHRLRGVLIAFVVLALSAGLAFGAQPDAAASGLANAAAHAGKIVPVQAGEEETSEDEDTDEDSDEDASEQESAEDSAEAGENCTTDPTALTPEELGAMRHGSIVCWAAQQTEWPEWFANHGSFVKCWAHQGKADATPCTEDPTAGEPAAAGASNAHGQGKGKGHNK